MSNLKSLLLPLLATVNWLLASAGAFAQQNKPAGSGGGDDSGSGFVLPYMVVILAIVLGLMVVARGSNRRERERPSGYVQKKFDDDD